MEKAKLSKREKSKNTIMHAAKGLFESKGIDNVTFNEIADASNVCRTTVFNHFGSIHELMLALVEQELGDLEEYCISTGLDGEKLITALFDRLIQDTAYYPQLTTKLINHSIISKQEGKSIARIEHIIKENLKCSNQVKDNKAMLIMGAYYGMVNHYHSNNLEFNWEEMQSKFHELLGMI
ncbi:MAG TPA: TetR/AcrR family transcriptional regulator [Anaerovoracaceae bacterium]|nr:TetR/AcrR family transcriptional regulator [Anaerovoracaceae bacterium]